MALAKRDEHHHQSPREAPTVGRPRGALWRSLQADGVVWEGQVLLVGGDVDLAARMIVTHRRVVFVRGGDVVLEIPRGWLRQEPVLRRDGVLEIFVTTPESNPFDEPMRVALRMREGHPAAGHIIAMLAPGGVRRIKPDTLSGIERAREASTRPTSSESFWAGLETPASTLGDTPRKEEPLFRTSNEAELADNHLLGLVEPQEKLIRVSSNMPRAHGNASGFPITGIVPRDQRKSPWGLFLRLAALTILLATAAALGAGRVHLSLPIPSGDTNAVLTAPTETAAPATNESDEPGAPAETPAPASALTPDEMTAVAIGVGGPESLESEEAPAQDIVIPTPAVTDSAAAPAETAQAPEQDTAAPAADSAAPAGDTAAPDEAAAAPEAAAAAPASPDEPADEPALSQQPAVDPNAPPAQEMVVGPMRLAIDTALRDESLPKYGLPPGDGDWVFVLAQVTNESDKPASTPMSDFRLYDRGTGATAELDGGTDVIAGLAGLKPALGSGDTLTLDPGDTGTVLLLYLLPPGSSDDLALLFEDNSMELAPSLEARSAAIAAPPTLVEAEVDKVINASELTVTAAGQSLNVSLLGIAAPTTGACFSAESTAALQKLVEGQSIWLERQATDTLPDGSLARDAWVSDGNGARVLLAVQLLESGNVAPNISGPDSRYEAWLLASSALARTNGAGLWGTCQTA
jgi:endonuclease YncB( thermonuclease family)